MNYPLISEYIEAIKSAEDNFEELSYLRPVLGDDGMPVMSVGNFAVVFKMKDEQSRKLYALKCFTKEQEGREEAYREIAKELENVFSPYLVSFRYLEKELFVDTDQTTETEFPVLLMDWVEGKTLDKYLRENLDDKYALEMLAYRFSLMAQWLILQPFAHGDLKPDNILIREDGSLVLVDYDGMYVPAMKGQKARELGSPDFRLPKRTENDFDKYIDDFSVLSILFSLKFISISPVLFKEYGAADRLLFSARDYSAIGGCGLMKDHFPCENSSLNRIGALFLLSLTCCVDTSNIIQLLHRIEIDEYPLCATEEEISNAWKDEKGVRYSHDKRRLLKSPIIDHIKGIYYVNPSTRVICNSALSNCGGFEKAVLPLGLFKIGDYAFYTCRSLKSIIIPNTVSDIGKWAFYHCNLVSLSIPNSVKSIGEWAFAGCEELKQIFLSEGLSELENGIFSGCNELKEIVIPKSVTSIGKNAFSYCRKLETVSLGDRVRFIGEDPFIGCVNLQHIFVPKGTKSCYELLLPDNKDKIVESGRNNEKLSTKVCHEDWENVWIDEYGATYSKDRKRLLKCPKLKVYKITEGTKVISDQAFKRCTEIQEVQIPSSVEFIGEQAFDSCWKLEKLQIPNSVKFIGKECFDGCSSMQEIVIPEGITKIEDRTFEGCYKLQRVIFPESLLEIGSYAFTICSFNEIELPKQLKTIGYNAFWKAGITKLTIPNSVNRIDAGAFWHCSSLESITLPPSISEIKDETFFFCSKLSFIELPKSIKKIGRSAFDGAKSLRKIVIPEGVTRIEYAAFATCYSLEEITLPSSISYVGDKVFIDCPQLKKIRIPMGTRSLFTKLIPNYTNKIYEE